MAPRIDCREAFAAPTSHLFAELAISLTGARHKVAAVDLPTASPAIGAKVIASGLDPDSQ